MPVASIVVPTRGRPEYLKVTLDSVAPQAQAAGVEVIVVDDGGTDAVAQIASGHGARYLTLGRPQGANAARNTGWRATTTPLIIMIDDDIEAPRGWLEALLTGVAATEDREVFGGPILARLEGGPRACGREPPPITNLDLGGEDHDVPYVWGANIAIRRSALERCGPFDESLFGRGEEEEWQDRYKAGGGRIRYVAAARLYHRRSPADSRLSALALAAYRLGRTARRNDLRKGSSPPLRAELRVLAGCGWHTMRRRCANGIVMGAGAAGRIREALAEGRG